MFKIFFWIFLFIIIPFLIVSNFVIEDELDLKYYENMLVRVKTTTGDIVSISLNDYIIGVVAGEMPISFEIEALKAQAVAARSYAMIQMERNRYEEYDVVDTVNNQVYLSNDTLITSWGVNYEANISKVRTAVNDTFNEYLTYDGNVAETLYFSTSVGFTEDSGDVFLTSVPYLQSVASLWDSISPHYNIENEISMEIFCNKLSISCDYLEFYFLSTTSTGRVNELIINGKNFNASDISSIFSLKSTYFDFELKNNIVYITTKGYGHGVGMSQYGAQAMALSGKTYLDILYYYYSGTNLEKF